MMHASDKIIYRQGGMIWKGEIKVKYYTLIQNLFNKYGISSDESMRRLLNYEKSCLELTRKKRVTLPQNNTG